MKEKPKTNYSRQGKLNRAAGVRFEAKVRAELKSQRWIICKWMNNIDLEKNEIIPAKRKYNPYLRALSIGNGFPDFICFRNSGKKDYEIIGVEVKANGWLDKEEKEKCKWLLDNKIFSKILIAKKGNKRGEIEYINFLEKYKKDFPAQ